MIQSVLPHPMLTVALLAMWILLHEWSIGHLLLGSVIALAASQVMVALQPEKPRLRRWYLIPKLLAVVIFDILRSNIAVARLIMWPSSDRVSGFVVIPLTIERRISLAILACIITSTPGTTWVEFHSARRELLIHTLDLGEDRHYYVDLIKARYESLIQEIFE